MAQNAKIKLCSMCRANLELYRWSRDAIKFQNPNLKSHESFIPLRHKIILTTFKLNVRAWFGKGNAVLSSELWR